MKKHLSQIVIESELFDRVLATFTTNVEVVDNIYDYYYGSKNKKPIYYDGMSKMVIKEYLYQYVLDINNMKGVTDWKQVILIRSSNENSTTTTEREVYGREARRWVNALLHKAGYSDDDIEDCLNSKVADKVAGLMQFHYIYPGEFNKIYELRNCYYYDINGAHCDALTEIFPKAKDLILKQYARRKTNPLIKKYFNSYVGALCNIGHRLTYNWIVQRTSKTLFEAISYVEGTLIYANTDGIIVQNPTKLLDTSKKLGEFKEEYSGSVYFYRRNNYYVYQIGDELKGSCRKAARGYIDLVNNKVVSYTISNNIVGYSSNDKAIRVTELNNIKGENLNEESKEIIL